eukprot:jgi/Mesvir1/1194/Mv17686-RA.1
MGAFSKVRSLIVSIRRLGNHDVNNAARRPDAMPSSADAFAPPSTDGEEQVAVDNRLVDTEATAGSAPAAARPWQVSSDHPFFRAASPATTPHAPMGPVEVTDADTNNSPTILEGTGDPARVTHGNLDFNLPEFFVRGGSNRGAADYLVRSSNGSFAALKRSGSLSTDCPEELECPICFEVMWDPVSLETGHVYDRVCIERSYYIFKNKRCPRSGTELSKLDVKEVEELQRRCREWALTQGGSGPCDSHRPIIQRNAAGVLLSGEAAYEEQLWGLAPEAKELHHVMRYSRSQGHKSPVFGLAVRYGYVFSCGGDGTVRVWRQADGTLMRILRGHTHWVVSMAIGNKKLYSASWDKTIRVWDLTTYRSIRRIHAHDNKVECVCLHEAAGVLYSGSWDKTIKVWRLTDYECVHVIHAAHSKPLSNLTVYGDFLFSCSDDKAIKVWHIGDNYRFVRALMGHKRRVRGLVAANGVLYSGSWDNTIKVWNIQDCSLVTTLKGHLNGVQVLCLGDGALFSGSLDDMVKVWRTSDLTCVATLSSHRDSIYAIATGSGALYTGYGYDPKRCLFGERGGRGGSGHDGLLCAAVDHSCPMGELSLVHGMRWMRQRDTL